MELLNLININCEIHTYLNSNSSDINNLQTKFAILNNTLDLQLL